MFSDADLRQIREKGISLAEIEEQLANFRNGFPYALLRRPALVNDGIRRLGETEQATWAAYYEKQAASRSIVKFVPASGAATRMFKDLFAFLGAFTGTPEQIAQLEERKEPKAIAAFFDRLTEFAFYPSLQAVMEKAGEPLEQVLSRKEYGKVLFYLLDPAGLNYGNLPKGLLKFHRYGQAARTPMEEHMVEGAHYARQADSSVHLHFTVSPEHQELFRQLTELSAPCYGQEFGVRYEAGFSIQHAATDTIAVDLSNEPFRNPDGSLLFRPAGHGALLANLGELEQDIIFIKNIDNVVPDRLKETTYHFKKVIAGLLLSYQERIYQYLHRLDSEKGNLSEGLAAELVKFLQTDLCMSTPDELTSWPADKQWDYLHNKLNRPIRICGMVRNDGDTGGGPFWVEAADGSLSLQVVETAQIDLSDPEQKAIMGKATHFNPVDIVCSIRSYKGEKFDLRQFRDPSTGFITQKSKDGKDLKAQELPGLWNGAMAFWNTIFVEVPLITFNPVKTVNDLLRPEHNQEG